MPEIKHQFTGGKMNKDLDERLVPNGEYRDAMNVQVATSEGSDVGTIQNILGNTQEFLLFPDGILQLPDDAVVVGAVSDEKVDTMYYFVWTQDVDYIFSFNGQTHQVVFVDKAASNILKFNPTNIITGINVIDGLLFWTDGFNEPKKINIQRCIDGTPNANSQTQLLNNSSGVFSPIKEQHITVIKKAPQTALRMKLITARDIDKIYAAVIEISPTDDGTSSFVAHQGLTPFNFSSLSTEEGNNEFRIKLVDGLGQNGIEAPLVPSNSGAVAAGLTGIWSGSASDLNGKAVVFQAFVDDGAGIQEPPGLPLTDYVIKGYIKSAPFNSGLYNELIIVITSIDGFPDTATDGNLKYVMDFYDESQKLFEFKYPRFSYRYKFEDGEYSPFAPFTQVAFSPGSFDYHPRKGYNIGMTNRLTEVSLMDIVTKQTPGDVVSIDILFKDDASPSVYVVDTIKPDDYSDGTTLNMWNTLLEASTNALEQGFSITKEAISSIVPSNQLLRPWDNVPKKALAQDITGNRIVYANYTQGYDLILPDNSRYVPNFVPTQETFETYSFINFNESTSLATNTFKSIKSLREYQLGVVFLDEHGRETPVISNTSGTIKFEKKDGDKANRIGVQFSSDDYPQSLDYFKFFIKETSTEYYNMAMDRWYSAGDGNIWLAFPSSDRNKIDIDTFLILKKGSDRDDLVKEAARYKVLAIENEAPDFIKTQKNKAVSLSHAAGGNADIFGTFDDQAPFEGRDEFQMNFAPFNNTAGRDLDTAREELWIEFSKQGSDETSERYKISSVTNNFEVGTVALNDSKYSLKLEKRLGNDVNFISDDPFGLNQTKIKDGAIVNVYKYKVENLDKFDGRFFVKIYFDEVFRKNIELTTIGGGLRSSVKKKVYSMRNEFVNQHTGDLTHFLTKGESKGSKYNILSENWLNEDNAHRKAWYYGYYLVKEFAAAATYFRKYRVKQHDANDNVGSQPAINLYNNPQDKIDELNDNSYQVLIHLENGEENNTNLVDGSTAVPYQGNFYKDTIGWWREFGYRTSADYYDNNTSKQENYRGVTARWRIRSEVYPALVLSGSALWYYSKTSQSNLYYKSDQDSVRDNEVWFIDAGPVDGFEKQGVQDLNFAGGTLPRGYVMGSNNYVSSPGQFRRGANTYTNAWQMELAFGGIGGSKPSNNNDGFVEGFWEVGNWNNSGGDPINSNYTDLQSFVDKLEVGQRFRWKEDPTSTIYTITGNVTSGKYLRHSWGNANINDNGALLSSTDYSPYKSRDLRANGSNANLNGIAYDLDAMAENLSFNFSRNWDIKQIQPAIVWDPTQIGLITAGTTVNIPAVSSIGGTAGATITGVSALGDDLKIFVVSLVGGNQETLTAGMALTSYTHTTTVNVQASYGQTGLVVRYIEELEDAAGDPYYALYLGGYTSPLTLANHSDFGANPPDIGTDLVFEQVGMNGYSPNSEFNINTIGHLNGLDAVGRIGAVGYTLEFVEEIQPVEILSENPAIWETEPKDSTDLEIYYEASGAIPAVVNQNTISNVAPIGTKCFIFASLTLGRFIVIGHQNNSVIIRSLDTTPVAPVLGGTLNLYRQDDLIIKSQVTTVTSTSSSTEWLVTIEQNLTNGRFILPWHNCYSFGNGVESNRIRDNFNLPFISNGVKASATLEQEYKEEHRKYGLIYSGIYNSTSGVNNLNQFIAAEKITKDVNPIYGSIQKLYSRDSDLVALCEDKILRIQANKDALFNADGNSNVVASSNVLGQTIPFSGEFGISTNPESFASENYRAYFTDKVRGAVIRLSKDGLTPISEAGMKDWFRDNLRGTNKLVGSFDDRNDEYNLLTNKPLDSGKNLAHVLSFSEKVGGWVSFKSFTEMQLGISLANNYYTFHEGNLFLHYSEKSGRNTFYGTFAPSTFDVILNDDPGSVKVFNTLNYEGSQAKVNKFKTETRTNLDSTTSTYTDQEYYNLYEKDGWSVESITTNKEKGKINEFLDKEGKWFNAINKIVDTNIEADTCDFTFQGIGWVSPPSGIVYGCTDSTASNYDATATVDDGSCILVVNGCTNPNAANYNPLATSDDGSCVFNPVVILGCTNPNAVNYDPAATTDDGSCNLSGPNPGGNTSTPSPNPGGNTSTPSPTPTPVQSSSTSTGPELAINNATNKNKY